MSHFFKSLVQSYVYLLCLDPARNGSHSHYVPNKGNITYLKKKVLAVYLRTMCDVACSPARHYSFICMAFQLQCILRAWCIVTTLLCVVHCNCTAFLPCVESAVQCEMHCTWNAVRSFSVWCMFLMHSKCSAFRVCNTSRVCVTLQLHCCSTLHYKCNAVRFTPTALLYSDGGAQFH